MFGLTGGGLIAAAAPTVSHDFAISPAVGGVNNWNLTTDGVLTLNVPGTWTITPTSAFAGTVELWGAGGSGGAGGTTSGTNASAGTATTWGALMTAGAGGPSNGTTTSTPTAGGAGGTASGGDVNTPGAAGTSGTVGGTPTTILGNGGRSSTAGATKFANSSSADGVTLLSQDGNAAGGGATGSGRSSTTAGSRRATGGGGGGGYVSRTYTAGQLAAGTPITVVVGDSGTPGTSNFANGGKGAPGRVMIRKAGIAGPGYALQWSDEFNYSGAPNASKWGPEGNFTVNGSSLVLTVTGTSAANVAGGEVRTADVTPIAWQDGYLGVNNRFTPPGWLEVRMKVSRVRGIMSSAFLMNDWNDDGGDTWRHGEIDMVEAPGNDVDTAFMSTHLWTWPGLTGAKTDVAATLPCDIEPNDFVTYACWWTSSFVRLYVNGTLISEKVLTGDSVAQLAFTRPVGLMLQAWAVTDPAMWGGEDGVDYASLPTQVEVDYVRFYALEPVVPSPGAPVNTGLPVITAPAFTVGQTLTCSTGSWTNSPTNYTYQWKLGTTNVGTNQNTYVAAAAGSYTCTVTPSNASGSGLPATANAVSVIANSVNIAVAASSDDQFETVTTGVMGSLTAVSLIANANNQIGLRFVFTGAKPYKGATITAAYLTVRASSTIAAGQTVRFWCQNSDSTATFTTTAFDISGRTKTTEFVDWTTPAFTIENYYDTPSIIAPVQAVVNRAAWDESSIVVIIHRPAGTVNVGLRSWDLTTTPPNAGAAVLHLEWT